MAAEGNNLAPSKRSAYSPTRSAILASIACGSRAVSLCSGATCTSLIALLAARPAIRDLALTTNGVLLAPQAQRAARRGPAPDHRQPGHARPPALPRRSRGSTASTRCSTASTRRPPPGFESLKIDTVVMRGVNDDELAALHRIRPTASARRSASSSTWTLAARRGGRPRRWFRAARCSRRSRAHYGPITPIDGAVVSAGRSLCAARRHDLRHHLVDDRTVLPVLRPQPAHRRRGVADVPLRARRNRSAAAAARWREPRRSSRHLIETVWSLARRPRRRGTARISRRVETLIPVSALKKDAHLEMHTRGG